MRRPAAPPESSNAATEANSPCRSETPVFDLLTFMTPEELDAATLIRDQLGVDLVRTFQFWEAAVARMVGGRTTGHRCPWDVELDYPDGSTIRIEVKFAQTTNVKFAQGPRDIYKFADPRGRSTAKDADVLIFIGVNRDDSIDLWVAPCSVIPQSRSITITVPRARSGGAASVRSLLVSYAAPFDQLLVAVLNAYHVQLTPRHWTPHSNLPGREPNCPACKAGVPWDDTAPATLFDLPPFDLTELR
jgi:hypothetical protein